MIRLVIVDDHALVRDGLRARLSVVDGLVVVGEAASGAEALALVAVDEPDLMLVDVGMRGMNGIDIPIGSCIDFIIGIDISSICRALVL